MCTKEKFFQLSFYLNSHEISLNPHCCALRKLDLRVIAINLIRKYDVYIAKRVDSIFYYVQKLEQKLGESMY